MMALLTVPRTAVMLCGLASAGLLAAAFGFEYLGGLAPCKLCLWQRWPHTAVVLFSLLGLAGMRYKAVLILIVISAAVTAGIAGYHVGVEQRFWAGPASCSSGLSDASAAALLDSLLATPVARCDEIAWSFAGLSMAAWNMVISAGLAGFAFAAWRRSP